MTDRQPQAVDELKTLLRSCVQCGLCLPHCATWLATGNEVHSPRGRLVLLDDVLNDVLNDAPGDGPGDPARGTTIPDATLAAFDQCIGCRACETACPSGVPFSLLEYGQTLARQRAAIPADASRPRLPGWVLRRLESAAFLRFLSRAAGVFRSALALFFGPRWRRRLDRSPARIGPLVRLLGTVPRAPESDEKLLALLDSLVAARGPLAPAGEPRPDCGVAVSGPHGRFEPPCSVAFFRGCANRGLLPGPSRRLVDLLRDVGCRVDLPADQDCCGALAAHTGRLERAAALRVRNRAAFRQAAASRSLILAEAAGCGLELKERLTGMAAQVVDAVELLHGLAIPNLGRVPLRVVVHDPCHARHGQGIVRQPRELLARIPGLILVEASEAEVCCGSGGAWGLRYPELSADLARRKAGLLAATEADLIVTSNPGCLGQIADGLSLIDSGTPILPLTDLLWYAKQRKSP